MVPHCSGRPGVCRGIGVRVKPAERFVGGGCYPLHVFGGVDPLYFIRGCQAGSNKLKVPLHVRLIQHGVDCLQSPVGFRMALRRSMQQVAIVSDDSGHGEVFPRLQACAGIVRTEQGAWRSMDSVVDPRMAFWSLE